MNHFKGGRKILFLGVDCTDHMEIFLREVNMKFYPCYENKEWKLPELEEVDENPDGIIIDAFAQSFVRKRHELYGNIDAGEQYRQVIQKYKAPAFLFTRDNDMLCLWNVSIAHIITHLGSKLHYACYPIFTRLRQEEGHQLEAGGLFFEQELLYIKIAVLDALDKCEKKKNNQAR
jgi:hypothetical protein